MNSLRQTILKIVLTIAHHAATNPYSYIFGTIVLSFALLGAGYVTNFDMNVVADESYTATDSVIREQKHWIEDISGFPPAALSVRVVIHGGGESVLNRQGVMNAIEVVEEVQNTPEYETVCTSSLSQHHYSNEHFVGGYTTECHIRGITLFWNNSQAIVEDVIQTDDDVLAAVSSKYYPDGTPADTREIMGKVKHHNEAPVYAESLLMEFMIPGTHQRSSSLQTKILNQLLDLRDGWSKSSTTGHFNLEVFTNESLETETTRAVLKDLPLIPTVFLIMTVFTCIIFSSNNRGSSKHVLLGLGAVVCVVLSLASSFGILWIFGVPFTSLTQILPFIMFGIVSFHLVEIFTGN